MKTIYLTVFEDGYLGGNPCPVTIDADNLTTEQMQKITSEFGFESAFIMKSQKEGCDFKLRYFVPLHEMEMCVHATLACSAVVKKELGFLKNDIYFETMLGVVHVNVKEDEKGYFSKAYQFKPEKCNLFPTKEEICKCLKISEEDLEKTEIASYRTSRYKLIIPLKSRKVLDNLKPDFNLLKDICERNETTGFYPYAFEKGSYYARQFPKNSGYPEDAATGVAASALGVYLFENDLIEKNDGLKQVKIYQGQAMGKPSFLTSEILIKDKKIEETAVCGYSKFLSLEEFKKL